PYVGRGGLKLEKIIKKHNIRFDNLVCMDIGASTGGFTDCMLQNGADYVYAVDVGSDQLAEDLKANKCVCNMEKTDVRNIKPENIDKKINFISVDVSFISLKLILPKAYELLENAGRIAVLVTPQFEAGKAKVGKNGIVKSFKVHENILNDIIDFSQKLGFEIIDVDYSPVTGSKGNIEYLLFMKKGYNINVFDIHSLVKSASVNLKSGGKA
ncbi:MAG: TlyA family RNA methyltransferase, partial [Oscillospiraceae bacterium]|nr:TlyA family RNA methyltransferase [Oscillospiraceae bacterium]